MNKEITADKTRDELLAKISGLEEQVSGLTAELEQLRKSRRTDGGVNSEISRYLQMLLRDCPDIIVFCDKASRIVYCSYSLTVTAGGGDPDNVIGRHIRDVFTGITGERPAAEVESNVKTVILTNNPLSFTCRSELGDDICFTVYASPAVGSDGSNEGVMLYCHDVSDIELTRIRAEDASKAKSTFLSNMSHEMRTPMNAIIGMTTLGKAARDIERKDYAFGKIEDASTHLLGVINDILDISKIEANKFELSPTEFEFERMLQKVVNVVNFRVDEKFQRFDVRIDENIPPVLYGDDQRIAQVVTNLLSNAVKFTPEGGLIRLDANLVSNIGDKCTLQISVKDTGIGIPEETLARLFSSFEQADASTSRNFGGTGLGLAISKSIVEMMDGEISVESVPGEGSTFVFTIKVGVVDGWIHAGMLAPGVNLENMHTLVVDDQEDVLDYFLEISRRLGFKCDAAVGGKEALALIQMRGGYDMYFIDWRMPEMDGIELARRISSSDEARSSVIIMISSAEWTAVEDQARTAGVKLFLSKPLFPSAISDMINDCLGSRSYSEAALEDGEVKKDIFRGNCVLFAEDVDVNREILLALLEPSGLAIDCAENGLECYEKYMANPERYDLILMDMQMPQMDGCEATRQIRASGALRCGEIPIIAMTANVFREDVERCIAAGMNDHIGKPLDFEEVMEKLITYLPKP